MFLGKAFQSPDTLNNLKDHDHCHQVVSADTQKQLYSDLMVSTFSVFIVKQMKFLEDAEKKLRKIQRSKDMLKRMKKEKFDKTVQLNVPR